MKQELSGVTSVMVPLYNHATFVEKLLDSLLRSDASKIELLICDDASTDDSVEIVSAWLARNGDRFFQTKFMENMSNIGVTANLNRLAAEATGEFITLIASDDMLAEKAIDLQRDYLQSHLAVDFVFSNCTIMDTDEAVLKPEVASSVNAFWLRSRTILMCNVLFNWNVIWCRVFGRRDKFLSFGKYVEEHCLEDRWSAIKIMNTGRYAYLHQVIHLYRYRGLAGHPAINSSTARRDFHDIERRLHREAKGLLYVLLWVRRLPFKTNRGKWPARLDR